MSLHGDAHRRSGRGKGDALSHASPRATHATGTRRRRRGWSFRTTLTALLIAAATLPAAGLATVLLRQLSRTMVESAQRELALAAEQAAGALRREVALVSADAATVGADADVSRAVKSRLFEERAEQRLEGFLARHRVASAATLLAGDGTQVTAVPLEWLDVRLPEDVERRGAEVARSSEPASQLGQTLLRDANGLMLVAPVAGLLDRVTGALVLTLSPRALLAVATAALPATGEAAALDVVLEDAGGAVLAARAAPEVAADATPATVRLDLALERSLAGEPGAAATSRPGVSLLVRETSHRRQDALRATLVKASAAALAALALLALAAFALARRITGPLEALSRQAERYAAGDYAAAPQRSAFAELDALGETLEGMGGSILAHIETRAEEERVRGELAKAQLQAELDALRTQLSPHFLFNSLNSIGVMSTFDAPRASAMVMRLAALYRGILDAGKGDTLPLAAEVAIVRDYLALEQMRFEERLAFTIEMPPEAAEVPFPGLLAQTLVENAVKHGIAKSREGGRITLTILALGAGAFSFRLSNTGARLGPTSGRGTGLANSRKRLDLLYGDRHDFEVATAASGETVVSFRFFARNPS